MGNLNRLKYLVVSPGCLKGFYYRYPPTRDGLRGTTFTTHGLARDARSGVAAGRGDIAALLLRTTRGASFTWTVPELITVIIRVADWRGVAAAKAGRRVWHGRGRG